jgi:hypothetical protein
MTPKITHTMMEMRARAQSKWHGDMAEEDFRMRFSALLAQAPPYLVRESAFMALPSQVPPWFDTGIVLTAGEQVTVFAVGRVWLARAGSLGAAGFPTLVSDWRDGRCVPWYPLFAYL